MSSERVGDRAVVRLSRPSRLNSLTTEDLAALAETIRAVDADGPSVIVLEGEGRAFCTGADLSGLVDAATVAAAADVIRAISGARAVVIARVQGPAAGVGASIAVACDLVVAAASAFFLMPFLPIGLVPDGGATRTLVELVGRARATRMILGGERIGATQAAEWGLIADVVPDDQLDARIAVYVDRILDAPQQAVFASKRLVRGAAESALEEALVAELAVQGDLLASDEYAIAREAFLAKRPISFRRHAS
ncbi:enoyl-CoA hydratase/isomerase family protein [Microbacterium sp. ASV49]|uniref:Enoyl-CoA hydratase-related protein n=1 Tax=Microbacterium candidum TaxID=3041922 RepID=A0ABT7MY11_9MICO|nr:enoyl-CoA hydratase-related protein [Microbacterium sp. ASV49]MDL9979345.1 enoyl-CoA hydratase-related protein [Microbacterium sp. ASV49]